MAHVQSSRHILDEFAKALEDIALVDKPAKMEGRKHDHVFNRKNVPKNAGLK